MFITRVWKVGSMTKGLLFILFFMLEMLVFAIIPLSSWLSVDLLLIFHTVITMTLLVIALLLRKSGKSQHSWQVIYALFTAGMAVLLSTLFSGSLLKISDLTTTNPAGIAVAKLYEGLFRVIPILALAFIIGFDRRSLYLNKGNIRLSLIIGMTMFIVPAIIGFLPLVDQQGMQNKLLELIPWILVFVLSNGFMEELLFRGLFLKRYEFFLGKGLSNLLTATVFTLIHIQVTYIQDILQFLLIIFPLAIIWGYLIQKTDSILASSLFHAGADCLIILDIFASI